MDNDNPSAEFALRDAEVPWPDSIEELVAYINSLTERQHDYGTVVYAMSMAAVAAFQYVAKKEGTTGFQAGCADLDIIRRTRRLKGPFMIVKLEDTLYPQYDVEGDVRKFLNSPRSLQWLKEQALEQLEKTTKGNVHQHVLEHWKRLAAWRHEEPTT
jgi:hypothetical protein